VITILFKTIKINNNMKKDKIKNIIVAITNRCNLKCKMCTIWKEKDKLDISPEIFKRIFKSKILDKNLSLTLTGGEPFLSKNFDGIIDVIKKERPECLKTISTNGYFTDKIISFLDDNSRFFPNLSISISLDGINKNDIQRGNSISNILKTIDAINEKYPKLLLKIKFTITAFNYEDLIPTYEFCKENGLKLKAKMSESAENYTNKLDSWNIELPIEIKAKVIYDLEKISRDIKNKDINNYKFIKKTIKMLKGKEFVGECRAPYERIFIMPNGTVYSCIHMKEIGNINKSSLDKIFLSESAEENRLIMDKKKCKGCVSFHGGN
jgi:MoaA/NifB/PqqE/SkfB family radical SAM enzyme